MHYAEVVVNIPIRRTFSKRHSQAPPESLSLPDPSSASDSTLADLSMESTDSRPNEAQRGLQAFHYHIPIELERAIKPGHLVWVPFGHREVQGIVVRLTEKSPVPTKPIARLARAKPILNQNQLSLATWIANYYVAPLSEALKLFIPPGFLARPDPDKGKSRGVRAKRELEIELIANPDQIEQSMTTLGRDSQQATVLAWMLQHVDGLVSLHDLQSVCGLKSPSPLHTLVKKNLLTMEKIEGKQHLSLALPYLESQQALVKLRGADKYEPILEALSTAGQPLWKSELYKKVKTDLKTLRALQSAGLLRLTEKVRFRDPLVGKTYAQTTAPTFTGEQAKVWSTIEEGSTVAVPKFLLHGVTGSGKTEIYLRTIEHTLAQDRQAIVLVPEIALTPQTVARFAGRFPGRVTVVHSELNQGERYDVWRMVRAGEFDVVVGPRSALFAPLPRLGLIILDEEHESSYKQQAEAWGSFTVFYDARTVAHKLAELTHSTLILGSATPSLESYHATMQGHLTLLEMPRRVLAHHEVAEEVEDTDSEEECNSPSTTETIYAELPPVEVVDLRQELRAGNRSIFSRSLQSELHATLDAGEQVILFLNRRGTNTFVMCRDCGAVQECDRCEVPLTYHERASVLVCHHCNQRAPIPEICPECNSKRIKYFGSGTQRIEELVQQIAPRARLLRWDADTTGRKGSHAAILQRFADHEADILVGTQMIAKGLDLPMVTLVGVISADTGLYLPDFRSSERTFQLLTQVAGRAGRSQRGGRVVIQTYTPEHYAIQAAAQHDYHAFYAREINFREEHGYPPIRRWLRLVYWDKNLEKAQDASTEMSAILHHRLETMGIEGKWTGILGPAPAFFARFRSYYRWQILLRAPDPTAVLRGVDIPFGWRVDVDPISML